MTTQIENACVKHELEVKKSEQRKATSNLALRDYQEEAIRRALAAKRGTIKAPTGTGKTFIAISWLQRINEESLIIVPTQALIYQSWTPKLIDLGFERTGQYYAYRKEFGDPITVTTFASAVMRPDLVLRSAKAVVVDEIHHLGARGALAKLLPKLKTKEFVLGLSSVPEREDKNHGEFLREFPICYELNLGEAIRKGYVAPLRVINVPAKMTEEEREQYRIMTERIRNSFRFCGPNLQTWRNAFDPRTRQYVGRLGMWSLIRRKKLLSQVEDKASKVLKIIQENPDERIVLFSESVPAIERLKSYLLDNNITCETFHAGKDHWSRQRTFERWGSEFQVLLSCRALDEGIDVKEVGIGILITNGKSKRQFIQRIGRIIRPMEGKQARFFVVYSQDTTEETYFKTIAGILTTEGKAYQTKKGVEISVGYEN